MTLRGWQLLQRGKSERGKITWMQSGAAPTSWANVWETLVGYEPGVTASWAANHLAWLCGAAVSQQVHTAKSTHSFQLTFYYFMKHISQKATIQQKNKISHSPTWIVTFSVASSCSMLWLLFTLLPTEIQTRDSIYIPGGVSALNDIVNECLISQRKVTIHLWQNHSVLMRFQQYKVIWNISKADISSTATEIKKVHSKLQHYLKILNVPRRWKFKCRYKLHIVLYADTTMCVPEDLKHFLLFKFVFLIDTFQRLGFDICQITFSGKKQNKTKQSVASRQLIQTYRKYFQWWMLINDRW